MDVEKTLAELALTYNGGPCDAHKHEAFKEEGPKRFLIDEMAVLADKADPGVQSALYMLLSLNLELWRRNEYAFEGLKKNLDPAVFEKASGEHALRIDMHTRALHSFEDPVTVGKTDWRKRAVLADAIVHRMLDDTEPPHRAALDAAMGDGDLEQVRKDEINRVPGLGEALKAGGEQDGGSDGEHEHDGHAPGESPA